MEKLTIWRLHRVDDRWQPMLTSPVNTGTHHSTANGSWPVYWRLRTTRMQGTAPSGARYNVPSVPWVNYYHGNDAIHGFSRQLYGFPQSAGCVELPLPTAHEVFELLHDGAVVTVSGRWRWNAGYSLSAGA